jgi:hypothetical protein
MTGAQRLDNGLLAALRRGPRELPAELGGLRDCLRSIGALLAEKAEELEASWQEAEDAAAEIATLQSLETAVAEQAIELRATTLADVRTKFAIWKALGPGPDDYEAAAPRDRLVLSIEADIVRICCGATRATTVPERHP